MHLNKVSESTNSLHSVEDFIRSAQAPYGLSNAQCVGFKVFMKNQGKYWLRSEREFLPYLRKYLGKD